MKNINVRPIQEFENDAAATVIRQVLVEFGLNREGFAFVDSELESLYESYQGPGSAYFVAEVDKRICGGGGFAALLGGDGLTAELKKMYLLPEARGLGIGRVLMEEILARVRTAGYQKLYLETMPTMTDAIRLYQKFGFTALSQALGNTGHFGCQAYYVRSMIEA